MATHTVQSGNKLLALLPDEERRALLACGEQIELRAGSALCKPGERIRDIYFPESCTISLVAHIDSHDKLGVGLAGNEGMFGVPLILGLEYSSLCALVQGGGSAWKIRATEFMPQYDRNPALQGIVKRYVHALMYQFAQTAVCNRFHLTEARLARWLLMTDDRTYSSGFHATQAFLAYMLGVRRVGISKAAGTLQKQKLISYNRGNIVIIDRPGLERVACSCYQADKDTFDRILG